MKRKPLLKAGAGRHEGSASRLEAENWRQWLGVAALVLALGVCLLATRDRAKPERRDFTAGGLAQSLETPAPPAGTLRVNEAELEELIQLPGVGETLAQAILDEREKNGAFHYAEDLMAVKGIGPAKLSQIRSYLDLGEEGED